ncbi:unnamed protein product, partial [Closterium sp. NIES-53]
FGVDIFALDYDAILATMYALSLSAEGDCYRCVPPDPGIEAAALGASESALPDTAHAEALHTFTLDSGASRCFFRDSTTLTPLFTPVPVRLADPSGGPVLARSSTVLPCLAVPSDSLSGLHLPSFSTNLVSTAGLQDAMVTTTTPGGLRVSICTCKRTSHHLATFTRQPGSSLYTLSTEPPQVFGFAKVSTSASAPFLPTGSDTMVSSQTTLSSAVLVHQFTPASQRVTHCTCAQTGRHLATFTRRPGSSLYTLTTESPPVTASGQVAASSQVFAAASWSGPESAPCSCRLLSHQTLLWYHRLGHPSLPRLRGMASHVLGHERYFLLVVDDYLRYTTVFPLRTKGGEFSSDLLQAFCRAEGIRQTFTLPASPQQNGIAERRIGMVMDVALRGASDQPSAPSLPAGDLPYSAVDWAGW